ncbi:MAG: GNAT family N-acetyltransferase [Candidatus Aenigmarchaeota archaeon]|nr:GNAT family N-acetyltransferase [Candidatus Aenigmarchaeota archaeon]
MRIRKARPADAGQIYRLVKGSRELVITSTYNFLEKEAIQQWVRDKSISLFVAEDKGKVIGLIYAELLFGSGKAMYLDNLVVHPRYRGKGVGTMLLAACTAEMKRRGIRYAGMMVLKRNYELRKGFFERNSFRKTGELYWIEKVVE